MRPLKLSTDSCPSLIIGMKNFFSEDLVWMIAQSEENWPRQQKQKKRIESFWWKSVEFASFPAVAIGCCMAVPNKSEFLMRWESIFCKDKLWIYFLRFYYSIGHGLLFQMMWLSLSCTNSSLVLQSWQWGTRCSLLSAWYKLCVLKCSHWEGAASLTQAGVNSAIRVTSWKQIIQLLLQRVRDGWLEGWRARTFEEIKPPDRQVASELTHCWQHLSGNGRRDSPPPRGHQSVCSSVDAEIVWTHQ